MRIHLSHATVCLDRRQRRPWCGGGGCFHVSPRFAMSHVARSTAAPQTHQTEPFPLVRGF
jgi:hypothetical protein